MATSITFEYSAMENAAKNIEELASKYSEKAQTLEGDFMNATSEWTGESRQKIVDLITNVTNDGYLGKTIPEVINSLAELLRQNATQMQSADAEIAENIPSSLTSES